VNEIRNAFLMRQIYKFLRLPSTDRCLLVKSAFLVVAIRLGLWLLPFQTLWRLLARMSQATIEAQEADQAYLDRVVWAVTVASRYMPGAITCLTRALASVVLLGQCGHRVCLRIGVAKGEGGQLEAHAWVECEERIVVGGSKQLSRYTPLPALQVGEP